MILDIFLPEKYGTKRLISKRTVNFHIEQSRIVAVVSHISSSRITVEKMIEQPFKLTDEKQREKAISSALKLLVKKLPKYDKVRISLPSSVAVFKEVTVPFVDPNRIRMVLDFEVEPMLPFPLDNAVIDFVVTDQVNEKDNKSSTILVVAARISDIEKALIPYQAVGIEPHQVTTDVISLYDMYHHIDEYKAIKSGSALIHLGEKVTRVAFMHAGKLRLMRHIPRGFSTLKNMIVKDTSLPLETVSAYLEKNGIHETGDKAFDASLSKHLANLFNDIQFTLNSFSLKLNITDGISKLLFTGQSAQLPDMMTQSTKTLQTPSEFFDVSKIFANKKIKNKVSPKVKDWSKYIYALAAATTSDEINDFNLRQKQLTLAPRSLIQKQWITACILSFCFVGYLLSNGIFQYVHLSKTASSFEKKELKKLKGIFPRDAKALKKSLNLKKMLKQADLAVGEKEEMWAPFSQQRLRPLEIILELTKLVDKKQYDVTIDELEITTEDGQPRIEIIGFFRSGSGYHFQDFGLFSKTFLTSKTLALVEEIDPTLADEKGVKFTAKLKRKES